MEPHRTDHPIADRAPPLAPPATSEPQPATRNPRPAQFVRGLTLFGTIALVAGNMLGTSLYTLPASLAQSTGPIGLLSWVVTAAGFLLVAMLYATLGPRYPATGGPYVFAREAFGDFVGFETVWMYWLSAVIGNAAIVTGAVAYAVTFSPMLSASRGLQFLLAEGVLWALCIINVRGIRNGARLQEAIILVNVVPLVLLGITLFSFHPANLHPFAPHGVGALATGSAFLVWAYAGIESATVPAEEVRQPERVIRRGTYLGYALATLVFLLSATAVIGVLPNDVIASSPRPLELAVREAIGPRAGIAVSMAAICASVGVLNGWIIMVGRIPFSASEDGLFFRRLARLHPRFGTPHVALIVGTLITSALLALYFVPGRSLLDVFSFIVLLANLGTLLPYLFNAGAALLLARRDVSRFTAAERRRTMWTGSLSFAFLLWTTYGVGAQAVFWGFLVFFAGVPLYILFATRRA